MGKKLILLFLFVLFSVTAVYAAANVEISELMYDPPNAVTGTAKDAYRCANDSSCQWIELHNKENFAVDLSSWKIRVNTKTNGNEIYNFGDIIIQPDESIVVATQLGDENSDGFSFAKLYGNKDEVWDANVDGFRAVDSDIPFIKTTDTGPDNNPYVEIRLLDPSYTVADFMIFQSHQAGSTYFVQKNNGYTMEKDSQSNFAQGLQLGGSPGSKRNTSPMFSDIPNLSLNEDQELKSRLIDFREYASDAETNKNNLTFAITSFSTTPLNLLTCGVIGTEEEVSKTFFLNCTNLGNNLNGKADVKVRVSDGFLYNEEIFSIIVKPVNDAPVITSTAIENGVVGLEYTYDVEATDIENNDLSFSLLKAPIGMSINSSTGVVKWKPTEQQVGNNNVEVKVRDLVTDTKSSTQSFVVEVKPVFGFSNVDVDYTGGSINAVNNSQTLPRVYTSSEFKITPTLLNRHSLEQGIDIVVEDVELDLRLEKDGKVIAEDVIDSGFSLSSLESKQVEYTLAIPRDLSEGVYKLVLEARGDLFDIDENLRDVVIPQTRRFELLLSVQQARHDVFVSSISVDNGEVCGKESNLDVIIQNSGVRTERNLQLRVNYLPLGIDSSIDIDKISPGKSNKQTIKFTNKPGEHNITASITYNGGESTELDTLENFKSCVREGDLNGDFCVNDQDSLILSSKLGLTSSSNKFESKFDLIKDSIINLDDFFRLADLMEPECSVVGPTNEGGGGTPPVSKRGFALDLSQLRLLIQEGTSVVSNLKITNNENVSIVTQQKLDGKFSSGDKEISFNFPNSLSILSTASRGLELKIAAPAEFKPGMYSGTFKVENKAQTELIPIEIEVIPDVCSNGINGEDISVTVNEPDRNENFKPGDKIDVDVSVRNKGSTKDIAVEGILWNVDQDEEVETVDLDSVELNKGDEEKDDFDFEIVVPDDVKNDKIVIYIKAYDDNNEDSQCTVKSVGLDVKREKEDVRLTSVSIPKTLTCNTKASVAVSARNFGNDKDDGVFFRVVNDDLGILVESSKFELKEFDKNGDTITKTMSYDIPEDAEYDKSLLTVEVVYNNGGDKDRITKEVGVLCEGETSQALTGESGRSVEGNGVESTGNVVESSAEGVKSSLLENTAAFLAVILGLGVLSYLLKAYIMMRK